MFPPRRLEIMGVISYLCIDLVFFLTVSGWIGKNQYATNVSHLKGRRGEATESFKIYQETFLPLIITAVVCFPPIAWRNQLLLNSPSGDSHLSVPSFPTKPQNQLQRSFPPDSAHRPWLLAWNIFRFSSITSQIHWILVSASPHFPCTGCQQSYAPCVLDVRQLVCVFS